MIISDEKVRVVVEAIKTLIRNEIAETTRNDPDSMGSYYEEGALHVAIVDLFKEGM